MPETADFVSVEVPEETESTSSGSNEETLDKNLLMEVWRDLKEQTRDGDSTHRQQQRKVFITPKTGAEWEGKSVPGSQRDPVSRRSHLAETVVLEKEASNVVPKSVWNRKKNVLHLTSPTPWSLIEIMPLIDWIQWICSWDGSLQDSVNRAQPPKPLIRAEKNWESICVGLGLATENN